MKLYTLAVSGIHIERRVYKMFGLIQRGQGGQPKSPPWALQPFVVRFGKIISVTNLVPPLPRLRQELRFSRFASSSALSPPAWSTAGSPSPLTTLLSPTSKKAVR